MSDRMTPEEAAFWLARLDWGSIGANVGELEDAFLALTAISSAAFDEGALAEKIADALRKSDLHNFDSLHAAQIAARVAREFGEGK